jgi:cytoskeletal protein CcmA (bactofilin family)
VAVAKPTLAIKGNSLALVIDGHIEGIIAHHKKHLTVGKQGRVKGQVHASSVTVLGQVIGEIRSDGIVSLAKGADVEGNIFCARVLIEDGARFIGQVNGEIRSDGIVSLAKGAYVEGNIFCARVLIEDGARFKGRIDTGGPPKVTAVAKEPVQAEPVSTKTPPTVAGHTAKSSVY